MPSRPRPARQMLRAAAVTGVAALLLAAAASPAGAAPSSDRGTDNPAGSAVASAGTAVGMVRLPPQSVPKNSIAPDIARVTTSKEPFESALGLTNTQVNSHATVPFERSVAQDTAYGAGITLHDIDKGLAQTAVPDNPKPHKAGLKLGPTDVDSLMKVGKLTGSVHARWSDKTGPCVGKVSTASTKVDNLSLGRVVPTVPNAKLAGLPFAKGQAPASGLPDSATLGNVGGLLDGKDGALVTVPKGVRTSSSVDVVPTGKRKAVRSTSTASASSLRLLGAGPLAMTGTVTKQPSLSVTQNGGGKASKVDSHVATVQIGRGSDTLFTLDHKHPTQDVPIGVATSETVAAMKGDKFGSPMVVGGSAVDDKGKPIRLTAAARKSVTDLFVLRLTVGELDQHSSEISAPFAGRRTDATSRLIDVQLLPTKDLADLLRHKDFSVTPALAQYAVGEQVARAAAPSDGVHCGRPAPVASDADPARLADLGGTQPAKPLLWGGAAGVLGGSIMLVAIPRFRRRYAAPSPAPRPAPADGGRDAEPDVDASEKDGQPDSGATEDDPPTSDS